MSYVALFVTRSLQINLFQCSSQEIWISLLDKLSNYFRHGTLIPICSTLTLPMIRIQCGNSQLVLVAILSHNGTPTFPRVDWRERLFREYTKKRIHANNCCTFECVYPDVRNMKIEKWQYNHRSKNVNHVKPCVSSAAKGSEGCNSDNSKYDHADEANSDSWLLYTFSEYVHAYENAAVEGGVETQKEDDDSPRD